MTLEITTPTLNETKKPAKELVISTLTYAHPLTLAKITNAIKKQFHASVTFQGVRKAAVQLAEHGVLTKQGKEYSINKDWILKLRSTVEQLQESYFKDNQSIRGIEAIGNDIKVYTFDTLIAVDQFWNDLIERFFEEDKDQQKEKYYLQQAGHTWFVLGELQEETAILEKMKKHHIQFYTLVCATTPLDRWCAKYYEDQGFHYITAKKPSTANYVAVYNDYVIQCTYPESLNKEIDIIYTQAKDFESFNIVKLIAILRKKHEIKLTVMRNPLVAEQLKGYILKHFRKSK